MEKINLADVAGCSPHIEKLESGKYLAKIKVFFYSSSDRDIALGEPCEEEDAIMLATAAAVNLMFGTLVADSL